MRNNPAPVDGITMKSPGKLIVDAAAGHLLERDRGRLFRALVAGPRRDVDEQIERPGMREFGLRAESAMLRIELRDSALRQLADDAERQALAARGKCLAMLDARDHAGGRLQHFGAAGLPALRQSEQNALKTGTTVAVFAGEIGAREKRAAIGGKNRRE